MKAYLRLGIAALAATLAPCAGLAQGTLYDDFSSSTLDPAKWVGFGGDPYWLDLSRQSGKGLEFFGVGYAPTNNNTSAYGGAWGIAVTSPNSVNGVSYAFTVKKVAVVKCKSSTQAVATSTDFEGSFFNAQGASSLSGDVELSVAAVRHGTEGKNDPLGVIAYAWECTNSSCGTRTDLFNQVIGNVTIGFNNTLTISWDQANHRFIFNLNGSQTILPYSVADSSPAYYPYKGFDIQRYVPYCTNSHRPSTLIDAQLGAVYVNP